MPMKTQPLTLIDVTSCLSCFVARVLVGNTTKGDSKTRFCPAYFDSTGNESIIVVYHDAQAYGEYLIRFQ
jgi:hypothetical protein